MAQVNLEDKKKKEYQTIAKKLGMPLAQFIYIAVREWTERNPQHKEETK